MPAVDRDMFTFAIGTERHKCVTVIVERTLRLVNCIAYNHTPVYYT